ncbi:MAG: glucose/arabinose dehydrogenase [Verrucomicrobiales bacterium]|jgi:glucose/arabinose dehydrogenase
MKFIALIIVPALLAVASAADTKTVDYIERLETPINFVPVHGASLKFEQPVWFAPVSGLPDASIVLEHQTGKAWLLHQEADGERKTLFADWGKAVSDGPWEGLMCVAFHPDFPNNRRFFVKHETLLDGKRHTVVVEKRAAQDLLTDSEDVSRQLIAFEQPADNHNGGTLAFGPDGFLYIAMGDGGPQEDPKGFTQSGRSFLGKMLRIDVDNIPSGQAYGIPKDNPFVERDARDWHPEIWALGFREPWRFSFDRKTGDLWLGDVGQVRYEEVCLVKRGENHGWNVREGWQGFKETYRRPEATYTDPLFAYSRYMGASITGGYVYRGSFSPSWNGVYVFADFNTRRVFGIRQVDGAVSAAFEIGTAPEAPSSFGQGLNGELYLVGYGGTIYHCDLSDSVFPAGRTLANHDWAQRRAKVRKAAESVMGAFPNDRQRIALDVRVLQEVDMGSYVRQLITYQSELESRTPAYLCIPKKDKTSAVLCLHPTEMRLGHQVVVGLGGKPGRQYAAELAERGFVTLSPAYPLMANYWPNLSALGYESGTMKAIWDNSRALDLLESLPYVANDRGFAAIGHSLGGHNALFTALFDDRIEAVVSSCGFDAFADYYEGNRSNWFFGKGWCQLRYMPRLSDYRDRLSEIPFGFPALLGALAPRKVFVNAPLGDDNFRSVSVGRCVDMARKIYQRFQVEDRIVLRHPDSGHEFPNDLREEAYKMIESVLGKP